MLAAFAGTAPWTGLCLANGLIGFVVLVFARDPVRRGISLRWRGYGGTAAPHSDRRDGAERGSCGSCCSRCGGCCTIWTGSMTGDAFALFILSDTQGSARRREHQAIARSAPRIATPRRIHYRRRAANTGFKAGNVMDFLDHHADGFELMLPLDAEFGNVGGRGAAAGAQHAGGPDAGDRAASDGRTARLGRRSRGCSSSACGRECGPGRPGRPGGRAMRAPTGGTMRSSASRRSAQHCRLPPLPGGRHILSHDQVEAAVLRSAGWGVRVSAGRRRLVGGEPAGVAGIPPPRAALAGGQHAVPAPAPPAGPAADGPVAAPAGDPAVRRGAALPAVPARRRRRGGERRSRRRSPRSPALSPDHRVARCAVRAEAAGIRRGGAVAEASGTATAGWRASPVGRSAEFGFTLLLDAVSVVAKTGAMLRPGIRRARRMDAAEQQRPRRGLGRGSATALAADRSRRLVFAGFASAGWLPALWALPLAGGLLLAIPLCVLTADPRFGRWMKPTTDRGDP